MINVFFPYYQCGDRDRQKEIDLCLGKNAENDLIDNLFVIIDDGCECPLETENIRVIKINFRLTYKKWLEMTAEYCKSGITMLCNSDIYFDSSLNCINKVLTSPQSFIALSRWELLDNTTSMHPNPHWSQDTWAMKVGEKISSEFMHQLDFPMGVPRCDNKIAYLFAVQGWKIFNPVNFLKSIHAHETQMRTYHKKLDDRILGGVAYVYPGKAIAEEARLDIDVWVKRSGSINKVVINKSMEKWIAEEAKQQVTIEHPDKLILPVFNLSTPKELANAMRGRSVLAAYNINFEVLEYNEEVFFKNSYQIKQHYKLTKAQYMAQPKLAALVGLIPPVLTSYVSHIASKAINPEDINFWQYPCATEKQAYENHLDLKLGEHVDIKNKVVNIYVPLPWATYVDKKAFPETYLARIQALISYYKTIATENAYTLKVHSVCQHIHWVRMLEMAQKIGITDFHLSHKDSTSGEKQQEIGTNLTLHGWPLIAVNYVTQDRSEGMGRKPMAERKLLASFIGAHMPHYRDDSRVKLFEAATSCGRQDLFVDLGNEWHFNKVVYEEQVLSREVEAHHIDEHHQKTFRYNTILSDSKFSLCPIGAGPNTLRFWESIAVGSIPVIFSTDLAILNENSIGNELLKHVISLDKIDEKIFDELLNIDDIESRSSALIELYETIEGNICFG
ncbi:exostosin domain-containing protein [Paraglaciecola marina]|uniref:exostosin domain-containing protein n=1 Tax=Paraglaciecola marina TaxID=2500157 RepID=UPI00105CE864|nr:exostosin family protein [Paraglaciecola marina]